MSGLDPQTYRLRRRFDESAQHFNAHDVVVRHIEAGLFEHLELVRMNPELVVDLGCGTGRSKDLIQKRFSKSQHLFIDVSQAMLLQFPGRWTWRKARRICADFHALPLRSGSVDLVSCLRGAPTGTWARFKRMRSNRTQQRQGDRSRCR